MNAINPWNGQARVFMRSLATREAGSEISQALPDVIAACKVAGFDLVIVETSGIGQGDAAIVPHVDVSMYVMTPEFGAASQLEKIDMLDFADFIAINKFDRKGAQDALRDVAKQYQRNRELWSKRRKRCRCSAPGLALQRRRRHRAVPGLLPKLAGRARPASQAGQAAPVPRHSSGKNVIVPPARARYLAEIADTVRGYHRTRKQVTLARERQQLRETKRMLAARQTAEVVLDDLITERDNAMDAGGAKKAAGPCGRTCRPPMPATTTSSRSATRKSAPPGPAHAVRHQDPQGRAAALRRPRRNPALPDAGKRAGLLPVHRRRVRLQARRRRPDPHVRRRRRRLPHQPPLQAGLDRHGRQAPVDRLRLGHPVRRRPGAAPGHLRQGRQLGRVDRDAGRHEGAVRRLRPVQPEHLGVDDHQRPGADHPGDVHEHRHRPADRQVRRRQRPPADRRRSGQDQGLGAGRTCAAPCRPTS
jgi:putative protein kinase ArgK-like GTPase of G3E family